MGPDYSESSRPPKVQMQTSLPEFRQVGASPAEYAVPGGRLTDLLSAEARLCGEKGLERFMWGVVLSSVLLAFLAGVAVGVMI
jgi:hypothetical protein